MNDGAQARLLIICPNQFGYHTDTYMYTKYLDEDIHSTYLCIDNGRPRISLDGVEVIYAKPRFLPGKFGRFAGFIYASIQERRKHHAFFVKQFSGSFILRFFLPKSRTVLDIRTMSVHISRRKQAIQNALILLDTLFFTNISVVSRELGSLIRRPDAIEILVGCDMPEDSVSLGGADRHVGHHIVYVGTFTGRKLETALRGFADYCAENPQTPFRMTFVGDGYFGEREELEHLAAEAGIAEKIRFTGYLVGEELETVLREADFGLVHVPDERRYAVQPSTKLFEYWAWGLPIIGTKYPMNEKYFRPGLGHLYEDSARGFYEVLHLLDVERDFDSPDQISHFASRFSWKMVVSTTLYPLMKSIFSSEESFR